MSTAQLLGRYRNDLLVSLEKETETMNSLSQQMTLQENALEESRRKLVEIQAQIKSQAQHLDALREKKETSTENLQRVRTNLQDVNHAIESTSMENLQRVQANLQGVNDEIESISKGFGFGCIQPSPPNGSPNQGSVFERNHQKTGGFATNPQKTGGFATNTQKTGGFRFGCIECTKPSPLNGTFN